MGENLKTHTFYCSLDATSKSCSVVSSQLHTVSLGFFLRLTREEVYTFSWALEQRQQHHVLYAFHSIHSGRFLMIRDKDSISAIYLVVLR